MVRTSDWSDPGGAESVCDATSGSVGVGAGVPGAAKAAVIASTSCEGAADLCGARAGQPCEPWCPSQAVDVG